VNRVRLAGVDFGHGITVGLKVADSMTPAIGNYGVDTKFIYRHTGDGVVLRICRRRTQEQ